MRSFLFLPAFLFAAACVAIGAISPLSGQDRTAAAPPLVAAQQKDPPPSDPTKGLTYKTPKGWRAVKPTILLTAKLEVGQGEQTGTFTIAVLRAPAGGLAANINRWRAQVGLDPLKEEAAAKSAGETTIDGCPGRVIDLTGPQKDGQAARRILAAFVTRGDQVWFFKLLGPADLVGKEKPAFEALLKSVRFPRS